MHILNFFVHWPDGAIWGNLAASLVITIPSVIISYIKLKRHQQRGHDAIHHHIDQQFTKLTDQIEHK